MKPDKFKSRYCINGKQEAESEYDDIFAPVCKHTTYRAMLWKCVQMRYELGQCDVHMAYVNAVNPREQYVHCPPHFKKPGYCLGVRKMLYGLHASGKEWNSLFVSWMLSQGFEQCTASDECLFRKVVNDRELFVCLYVDDYLYCGDNELMAEFKAAIETRFKVRHLDGTEFLGLTIKYDLAAGGT